jgi:hypothetical protein
LNEKQVLIHLTKFGFLDDYYDWVCHGEDYPPKINDVRNENNPYVEMINDALRDRINTLRNDALNQDDLIEPNETPHPEISAFFNILDKAKEPLYPGCAVSLLEAASRLVTLKCEFNLPHRCVNGFTSFIGDVLPKKHVMTRNFNETKKLLRALQLPHEKIDCCPIGCMLFWHEDAHLDKCKKCGKDRYKPQKNSKGKIFPKRF